MSQQLIDLVRAEFGDAVLGSHANVGDATLLVVQEKLLDIMGFLCNDPRVTMDVLVDVTAVDFSEFPEGFRGSCSPVDANHPSGLNPQTLPRFEVVYHLLSMVHKHRLRVKVPLSQEDPAIPSLSSLWIAANWGEREAYDMYGIEFIDHPDLRRILMYDEFEGYPLRKDYPLRGYQPLAALPTLDDYANHEVYR